MTKGVRAGILYFAIIFAVGFVLGVLRTLAVQAFPTGTRLGAVLVEIPIILVVAWMVCGIVIKRLKIADDEAAGIAMGISALALLLLAEVGLSTGLNGLSLQEHFALYYQTSHLAGLMGQCVFAVFPWLRVRFRRGVTKEL